MFALPSRIALGVLVLLLGVALLLFAQNKPPLASNPQNVPPAAGPVPPGAPPLVGTAIGIPGAPPPAPGAPPVPPPAPGAAPAPPAPPGPAVNVDVSKATLAVQTAGRAKPYLSLSRPWAMRAPRGELDLKVALVYDGAAVGVLRFDPRSGDVLPKGYNPWVFQQTVSAEDVIRSAQTVLNGLEVLNGAEYREPEACWVVPLAYQGRIVAEVRVTYDGTGIVPDTPATQEMQAYAK